MDEQNIERNVDSGKAGFLSVLVPGLGHVYAKKTLLGFAITTVSL